MLLPCLKPLKAPPFSVLFMMLCISQPLSISPNLPRTALLSVFPSLATQAFIQSSKNLNHIPSYPRPFSCTDIFIKVLFFLPLPHYSSFSLLHMFLHLFSYSLQYIFTITINLLLECYLSPCRTQSSLRMDILSLFIALSSPNKKIHSRCSLKIDWLTE